MRFCIVLILFLATIVTKGQVVAFVDMDRVLENMKAYKGTLGEIDKQINTYQKTIDNMQKSIDSLYKKLEVERFLLTEEAISNRERQINVVIKKRSDLIETYFGEDGFLVNNRKKIIQPYLDKVMRVIQDYAVRNEIDIIFDKKKQNNIIFASPALDVTKDIMAELKDNGD